MFCSNASEILEKIRDAESRLVAYAKKFGDRDPNSYDIICEDTPIPVQVLPVSEKRKAKQADNLYIHSVRVQGKDYGKSDGKIEIPLVILHGYMNGALYFYRNLVGLSKNFDTVYSLDTLGCGLSSRCPGLLQSVDSSVEKSEEFFVESLEAWRKAKGISKMKLAGHSIGGYISVAYCERYPENVEQLVLLSPAGVTQKDEEVNEWLEKMSFSRRMMYSGVRSLFDHGVTPAGFARKLSTSRSKSMVDSYVQRRLFSISDPEEQQAVADYLYYNAMLPGSGEDMLSRFLTSTSHARIPTVDRIPYLSVPKVSFIYGENDWMDIDGGIEVAQRCQYGGPTVDVYRLEDAGHMLMVDNWRGFHAGVVAMCGGPATRLSSRFPMPTRVCSTY